MAETVSVNFSGPALALLLYENVNAGHEQEGFLLGDTHVVLSNTVTDAASSNVHMSKIINVKAVVACPETCLFYNGAGQIDKEKVKAILGPQMNDVVGWFKYEPYSNLRLTLRSKIIHKELSNVFSIAPELFTCCLLTSKCSENHSTHTYTHTLFRYRHDQFETVPLHIENLGDPYDTYKPKTPASQTFLKMCESLGVAKDTKLHIVSDIQGILHDKIVATMANLVKSEQKKANLKREVEQLRQQLEYRRNLLAEEARAEEAKMKENETIPDAILHENICFLVDEENNEMADASEQMDNTNSNKQVCLDAGTSSGEEGEQNMDKEAEKNKRKADAMESKNDTDGELDVSNNICTDSLPANNPIYETTQLSDLTLPDGAEEAKMKENETIPDAILHENICFLVDEENNEMADASEQMDNTNSNKQVCLDAGTSSDVEGEQNMGKEAEKNKRKADAMESKHETDGELDVSNNISTDSLPANNPIYETTQLSDLTLPVGEEQLLTSATNTNTSVAAAVAENNKRKAEAMESKNETDGELDVSNNISTDPLSVNNPIYETTQLSDLTLPDCEEHLLSAATNTNTSAVAAVAEQPMK